MSETPRTDKACDYTAPEKLHRECEKLELELAAANAELAELRKDKARLDWLICVLQTSGSEDISLLIGDRSEIDTLMGKGGDSGDAMQEGGEG